MRTHDAVLELGPPDGYRNIGDVARHGGIDIGSGVVLPEVELMTMDPRRIPISMPTFLAYTDGGTIQLERLRTQIRYPPNRFD